MAWSDVMVVVLAMACCAGDMMAVVVAMAWWGDGVGEHCTV